jgi:hypothetical protein
MLFVAPLIWNLQGHSAGISREINTIKLHGLSPQSELCRLSDLRLSAKLVPIFADRGRRVVSATDPHGCILGFLDWSRYFSIQVAPQLSSWGWVDPVLDPLLLIKFGSGGNQTRDLWICSQELWPLDHGVMTFWNIAGSQKIALFNL